MQLQDYEPELNSGLLVYNVFGRQIDIILGKFRNKCIVQNLIALLSAANIKDGFP